MSNTGEPRSMRVDLERKMETITELNDEIEALSLASRKVHSAGRLKTDSDLMTEKRVHLRKFEPLRVDGRTISGMSIGGYQIDLEETARKAREILPIPASRLPVIFVDEELNFYHHFFQGLSLNLPGHDIDFFCSNHIADGQRSQVIADELNEIIETGYEKDDSELTILLKKVLTSTFEPLQQRRYKSSTIRWEVVANLWGFQYIEPGMTCRSEDIAMWLQMSYSHYRLLWFNNFKSTTIPKFAQMDRSKGTDDLVTMRGYNMITESKTEDQSVIVPPTERRHSRKTGSIRTSRRSHYSVKDQQSIGLQRWIAGK